MNLGMLRSSARAVLQRGVLRQSRSTLVRAPSQFILQSRGMADYPDHELVGLPALSPTMTHGNLASWKVKEGGSYGAGDVICEVETDKATVDFEAQDDGIVAKILVPEGTQDVPVGAPIFVMVEDEADVAAFADFVAEADPEPATKDKSESAVSSPSKPAPKPDVVPLDKEGKPVAPADFLVKAQAPPGEAPKAPVPSSGARKSAVSGGRGGEGVSAGGASVSKAERGSWVGPLASLLAAEQQKYIDLYGLTGTKPVAKA